MPKIKGDALRILGAGIDTITGQQRNIALTTLPGTVSDVEKTKVESTYTTGNSKFYQSTNDFLFNFKSDIAFSIPQTVVNANIDFSHVTNRSKHSVFYVFEIYSISYLELLQRPRLSKDAENQLQNKQDLFLFFLSYGNAFIKSITYGKHIMLILKFDNLSQENKTSFGAEIKMTQAAGLGFETLLDKKFSETTCEAYLYTAGLAPEMPVLRSAKDIDAFLLTLPAQIKAAPDAQIMWSYDSYCSILDTSKEFEKINAQMLKLERISFTTRYLKKMLNQIKTTVMQLISSLNLSELEWDRSQQDNNYSLLHLSKDPSLIPLNTLKELLNNQDGVILYQEDIWFFDTTTEQLTKTKPLAETFKLSLESILALLPVEVSSNATAEQIFLIAGATGKIYPGLTQSDLKLFLNLNKLEQIHDTLKKLSFDIKNNAYDKTVLINCWAEISHQNRVLKQFVNALPTYLDLPVKIISGNFIRNIKHGKDRENLTFTLPTPPGTVEMKLSYAERTHFPIELKAFYPSVGCRGRIRYKKMSVSKNIFLPSLFIPIPEENTRFYLKHHENVQLDENFQVKFYAKVKTLHLSNNLLPEINTEPDMMDDNPSFTSPTQFSTITFFKSPLAFAEDHVDRHNIPEKAIKF